jgi:hypothetical protein
VVDAFTARFNNAAAYATLRELVITGCNPYVFTGRGQLTDHHALVLSKELPVGTRIQYEAMFLPDRSVATSPTVYLRL